MQPIAGATIIAGTAGGAMKPFNATVTALSLSTCLYTQAVSAGVAYMDNMASFLAASGAASIGTLPASGAGGTVVGDVTFTNVAGSSLAFSQVFTNEFDTELAVSGDENFNMAISIAVGAYAFGFQIHEPSYNRPASSGFTSNFGCNATCADTTFRFEFFSGTTSLGQFLYNAPNDGLSTSGGPLGFFGFHSDVSFNRIEVRDITSTIDNEYFGNFLIGNAPLTAPIPEPETYAMLLLGLAILGFETRRRKKLRPTAPLPR